MVDPRSAIVYGASSRRANMGSRFLERIATTVEASRHGPRDQHDPIATEADLVVISLPPAAALDVCRSLEGADVGVVVIATALPMGAESHDAVARIGTPETIVLGPASNGYVVAESGLRATSNPVDIALDVNGCSVIGQSGGLVLNIIGGGLSRRGIGMSLAVCTGREWRDSWSPLLSGLLATTRTAAWLAVTEHHVAAAALRVLAGERDIPAGLLHLGRTSAGSRVAASHSAALSVPSRLVAAACDEAGVLLVDRVEAAIDLLEASFSSRRPVLERSKGVTLLGSSGGTLAYAADRLSDAGVTLMPLTDAEHDAIAPTIDLDGSLANPCDIGARLGLDHHAFAALLATLAGASPRPAVALCISTSQYEGVVSGLLQKTIQEDRACHVVPAFEGAMNSALPASRDGLLDRGIVVWSNIDAFIASTSPSVPPIAPAADRRTPAARGTAPRRSMRDRWLAPAPSSAGPLDEAAASPLVSAIGFIRPNEWFVALEQCREVTSSDVESHLPDAERLVIKAVDPDLPHRAAAGLLRIVDRDGALPALEELRSIANGRDQPVRGFLLQEFLDFDGPELLLAARVDRVMGPYLMIGRGGSDVERSPDIEIVFDPKRLQSLPELLARFGAPSTVVNAGSERLQEISGSLLKAAEAWQRGIEINPIVYDLRCGGWVALDALIEARVAGPLSA